MWDDAASGISVPSPAAAAPLASPRLAREYGSEVHRVDQVLDGIETSGFGSGGAGGRRCRRMLYLADGPTRCLSSSARSRSGSRVRRRKAEIFSPTFGCGRLPRSRWGFTGSCFVSQAGRTLRSQGRGHPPGGGLCRVPTSQAGNGIGGLRKRSLVLQGRAGFTETDPMGSVSEGESTAWPEPPSLRGCRGGRRLRQPPTNRGARPSVCLPAGTGARGWVRPRSELFWFFFSLTWL